MTVKHLLEQKGRNLWTIDPDATVLDALAKMAEKDIGSLVVMDGEELIGIITERHYSRNVILKGKRSPTTLVRDIMERNVIHVRPEQSVEVCMALMTDRRVRHLPVLVRLHRPQFCVCECSSKRQQSTHDPRQIDEFRGSHRLHHFRRHQKNATTDDGPHDYRGSMAHSQIAGEFGTRGDRLSHRSEPVYANEKRLRPRVRKRSPGDR